MKKIMWIVISLLFLLIISIVSFFGIYLEKNDIKSLYLNEEDKIVIELLNNKETYCYVGDNLDNAKWIKSIEGKCILNYVDNNENIFLKNKYENIYKFKNIYDLKTIKEFTVDNKIYLAIGGNEKVDYTLRLIDGIERKVSFKSNEESIATVDNEGVVVGKSVGETQIILNVEKTNLIVDVVVTDKIVVPEPEYNYKREYIKCDEYTKEDNDLIDKILASRIEKVGKGTRAAVVEASRFMTLEFPKRIPYFAENGRLSIDGIDGEGRYYKEGMFLNESRYDSINKSMYGPASWGCSIYAYPVNRIIPNGLDCSGFVSWAFINAGFDVGDIGAGITPVKDFTDLGTRKYVANSVNENSIVVGDLLSGTGPSGGHIAIVTGIHNGHYYISESLYADNHTYYGVITRKYVFQKLKNFFTWHIDMREFYNEDGKLTNYWIN